MTTKTVKVNGHELIFYNYKEPLEKIPRKDGFGFYGAVLASLDGQSLQCHACGDMFDHVAKHAEEKHGILKAEYQERFKLAKKTKLVSERYRLQQKKAFWDRMKANPELLAKFRANWGGRKPTHSTKGDRLRLETINKRGTCPQQLLEKILQVKRKLKRTPTLVEFVQECGTQRYKHIIYKVYGSWVNALKILKLSPQTVRSSGFKRRYSRDELIEYMQVFSQENQALPTDTDMKRGLLPNIKAYRRVFGSLEQARNEAELWRFVGDGIEQQRIKSRKRVHDGHKD